MMMQQTMLARSADRIGAVADDVERMEHRLDSLRATLLDLIGEENLAGPNAGPARLC